MTTAPNREQETWPLWPGPTKSPDHSDEAGLSENEKSL